MQILVILLSIVEPVAISVNIQSISKSYSTFIFQSNLQRFFYAFISNYDDADMVTLT